MSRPLHTPYNAEETPTVTDHNTFKFHVRHGSARFHKGVGSLHIEEDGRIQLELPMKSTEPVHKQYQMSPKIEKIMVCEDPKKWRFPMLELSQLPKFIALSLLMLMVPFPETVPWPWVFRGIGVLVCFNYILVESVARLIVEFEDNTYVCIEIADKVLHQNHARILTDTKQ